MMSLLAGPSGRTSLADRHGFRSPLPMIWWRCVLCAMRRAKSLKRCALTTTDPSPRLIFHHDRPPTTPDHSSRPPVHHTGPFAMPDTAPVSILRFQRNAAPSCCSAAKSYRRELQARTTAKNHQRKLRATVKGDGQRRRSRAIVTDEVTSEQPFHDRHMFLSGADRY